MRDGVLIAHRSARAFSWLRPEGGLRAAVAWVAYPVMWLMYLAIAGWHAASTVHSGGASAQVPNPVRRPARRSRRVLALAAAVVVAVGGGLGAAPWRWLLLAVVLASYVAAGFEFRRTIRANREAGSLSDTEALLRPVVGDRPLVRGGYFAAWPQRTGAGGALWRAALAELARDGVSLVVSARDDSLADTYVDRFNGTRPNPDRPRHIAWLNL